MQAILLAVIVILGAKALGGGSSAKLASWGVVGLTIFGVYTSPDVTTRLVFVGAAMLGPILAYLLAILASLTIRPFLHYMRWSSDAHRSMFDVHPNDPLYAAAGEQIKQHIEPLESSGYSHLGRVGLRVGKLTIVNTFFDRGNGREWVIMSATIPAGTQPVILHATCSFAGDETLVVSNYPWVDPTPPSPGNESVRLPSISAVDDLVRACLTLAGRPTRGPIVATPLDTDLLTRAKERTKHRQDREAGAGWLRYDAANGVYRATLRNAYRMFWRSVPPGRWIAERQDLARERELLAEMKLNPAPRSDTPAATPRTTRKEYVTAFASAAAVIALIVLGPDLLGGSTPAARPKPQVSVPGDFAVPDSFPGAVQALEQLIGRPSHQLSGTRNDEPNPTPGVAISMQSDTADAWVSAAHEAFFDRGFYLFRTGERATSGLETDALALYPTRDAYVVMQAMETNASNYRMSTEDVIAWFRGEERRYPIRFEAIGFDYVGGRLIGPVVPDERAFAKRFIKFCPDLQAEGPLSARSLGNDFKRTREIYCWWD